MAVYMISYDLNKSGQDYSGLYDAIKSYKIWMHYLDSTWLISTDQTPNQIYETLEEHVDENDRLLIIEVKNNYYGWLPNDAWDYLKGMFN